MILGIPNVLSPAEVGHCREVLASAEWVEGRATAGDQSSLAKHNLQLAEGSAQAAALGELILRALGASPLFLSAALPARVFPPLFNLYRGGMGFGDHVDNAIRAASATGLRYRTDLSGTLFLTDPNDYAGGELVVLDDDGPRKIKLAAGDLALYPSTRVHRVEPVRSGARLASFFWVQSMVADPGRRDLLHQLDRAIAAARTEIGDDHAASVSLVGVYHNLIRMWAAV